MTWLTRRVWQGPLWLLIACAPGAIAQPDPQPPSSPIGGPSPIEVPTTIEVLTQNADSADPQPDSDPSASGLSDDALSGDGLSGDGLSGDGLSGDGPDDALSDDGPLREPAGTSSANSSDGGDDFKPSEEISEDFSISLPVDI